MREMNQERSIRKKVEFQQSSENRNLIGRDRGRKYLKVKIGNVGYSKL